MSDGWKAFTDLVLQGDAKKTGGISGAALYGHDGAKWHEQGVEIQSGEIDNLMTGMKEKDNAKFQSHGIVVGGVKYMYLQKMQDGTDKVIGKKGKANVMLRLTKKALVIAITSDGTNVGNITMVDFVAEDLVKKGF